ncbi:MAG: HYR domain-containing protein, partial [Bacteroidetes bacterium]|nr:HYR domain-containing protein [Bacteroidota bacterium]
FTVTVTVTDTTPPVIYGVTPTTVTGECNVSVPMPNVTVTDNCDGDVTWSFYETITPNDCGQTLVRTWIASDACGNVGTASQTIQQTDNSPPIFTSSQPTSVIVECNDIPAPIAPVVTDNCDLDLEVIYTESIVAGDCAGSYTIVRNWVATDDCGNTACFCQTVTVQDTQAPVLYGVPGSLTLDCAEIPPIANVWASDNCTNNVSVNFYENIQGTDCNKQILRSWIATDECGNSTSATQIINLIDNTPPVITPVHPLIANLPNNGILVFECDGIVALGEDAIIAYDVCDDSPTISFDEYLTSTNDCERQMICIWTATDDCGNTSTYSITVRITDTTAPVIHNVPNNVESTCGSIPPVPNNIFATDNCDNSVSLTFEEIPQLVGCQTSILRKWTATDNCGNAVTKIQSILLNDNQAPVFTYCPDNIVASGDDCAETVVNWTPPVATDNCGSVTITSSHQPGSVFPQGITTVTYTATDACGNASYCSFTVTATGGGLSLLCESDTTVHIGCDYQGAYVCWSPPEYETCCESCNDETDIPGFMYLGVRNGHRYYCSTYKANWWTANAAAEAAGGHLAIVNDASENSYLANFLENQHAFIGLNDSNQEGNFTWVNGEALTYTNWYPNQPNDYNGNQDFVQLLYTGQWNDTYGTDELEFIMEIPCVDIQQIGGPPKGSFFPLGTTTISYMATDNCGNTAYCSFSVTLLNDGVTIECPDDIVAECTSGGEGSKVCWPSPDVSTCCDACPEDPEIPGWVYMGEYLGHRYYCSTYKATWWDAKAVGESMGGYLAVINDAVENQMLGSFLRNQHAYVGLSDHEEEGVFKWVNGDPVTFENWYPNQPNDYNNSQDFVQLLYTGEWNDTYVHDSLEFIVELPCYDVKQIAGLPNGSIFPVGTSTVSYAVEDNCGNKDTCSFNVTIENAVEIYCPENIVVQAPAGSDQVLVNWNLPHAYTCCGNCDQQGTACVNIQQIGGLPNGSYFPIGETTITYMATDECESSATCSFTVTVQASEPSTYCESYGQSTDYSWIKRVQFGEIYNESGNDSGYGDYTSIMAKYIPGSSYVLKVYPGFGNQMYYVYWKVWIDFNQDGDFYDEGEQIFCYKHYMPLQTTIKIPEGALPGATRMRVSMSLCCFEDPCSVFSYGEVEDYTVIIADESGSKAAKSNGDIAHNDEVTTIGAVPLFANPIHLPIAGSQHEFDDDFDFQIYPNPTSDRLYVELDEIAGKPCELTIYNNVGQRMNRYEIDKVGNDDFRLDLQNYADGIYWIELKLESEIHKRKRFIVQKN